MRDKDNKIKENVARLKIKILGRYMPRWILFQGRTQGGEVQSIVAFYLCTHLYLIVLSVYL